MSGWEDIWKGSGAHKLWTVPDARVADLAVQWRSMKLRRVLDLGCGIGRHVHLLASLGFEVHGIDHSATGIESCRAWLAADGLHADVQCGEMGSLPFPDGYFDAIVAFNSIYHARFHEVRATLGEMRRTLRGGGACFVTMISRRSRLYGKGAEVEPHTYESPGLYTGILGGEGEAGVPHYFSSEEDIHHFFHGYAIQALEHAELQLAARARGNGEPVWLRIPQSYFWRITASKVPSHDQ